MLAHAGGAATLDAPTWLLAYGAAALVLLATVARRGALVVEAARDHDEDAADRSRRITPARDAGPDEGCRDTGSGIRVDAGGTRRRGTPGARVVGLALGRVVGVVALATVLVVALGGPEASAANLAPSAVLAVWWIGLPLACVVGGDVMRWLDPFATVATLARRARPTAADLAAGVPSSATGTAGTAAGDPASTGAASLAVVAWWVLAFHDARSPRLLGWALGAYAVAAVAGAGQWGPCWLRRGEGFGALSSGLAATRRAALGRPGLTPSLRAGADASAALVSVWLGAVVFDLFSGTRGWVELAGDRSGWDRTGLATACLVVAVALAWAIVAGTVRLATGRSKAPDRAGRAGRAGAGDDEPEAAERVGDESQCIRGAVVAAWLATTTGAFLAHGLSLLLVEGQFALALVSDPLGRGWDLFGTARRAVDYSPLSAELIGTAQVVLLAGGGVAGVLAAAALLRALDGRTALRALWTAGLASAAAVALLVATMASDLE